jgi:hypothetical protein
MPLQKLSIINALTARIGDHIDTSGGIGESNTVRPVLWTLKRRAFTNDNEGRRRIVDLRSVLLLMEELHILGLHDPSTSRVVSERLHDTCDNRSNIINHLWPRVPLQPIRATQLDPSPFAIVAVVIQ